MPKIRELYAFISFDENENDEGVMAFMHEGSWLPLIGSDMDRIHSLIPIADDISAESGKKYKLLHFKLAGEIEIDK